MSKAFGKEWSWAWTECLKEQKGRADLRQAKKRLPQGGERRGKAEIEEELLRAENYALLPAVLCLPTVPGCHKTQERSNCLTIWEDGSLASLQSFASTWQFKEIQKSPRPEGPCRKGQSHFQYSLYRLASPILCQWGWGSLWQVQTPLGTDKLQFVRTLALITGYQSNKTNSSFILSINMSSYC